MYRIVDHPFFTSAYGVTINESTYYDWEIKKEVSVTFFNTNDYPKAMEYAYSSMTFFQLLRDNIEDLYLSIILFRKEKKITEIAVSATPSYSDYTTFNGFNSSRIISYLIKNWINRYVSCIETCFNLIKHACEINIGKELNYPKNILKHFKDKSTNIYDLSNTLNDLLQTSLHIKNNDSMRVMNNQIKHFGKLDDPYLSELFISNFLMGLSTKLVSSAKGDYNLSSKKTHKLLLDILIKKSNELEDHLVKVLDGLTTEFEKRFENIKELEKD